MDKMNKYKETISVLGNTCTEFDFPTELAQVQKAEKDIADFHLRILFSGGFSAGKSAAINILLGTEIMRENQTPETAIVSEIMYDEQEYVEAVEGTGNNRHISRHSLSDAAGLDPSRYEYLIWHLNNDMLRQLRSFVLVDMPGFNSGIQNHNKAILRYAGQGNAYILVIDCEDGEIKESLFRFMEEIRNYDNNVAIALTKTDKRSPAEVDQVAENVEAGASNVFGGEVKLVRLSKYEKGSAEALCTLIKSFDQADIFRQTFAPQLYDIGSRCIFGLSSMKKGLKLDDSEIQAEIRRREEARVMLEESMEDEKRKLSQKMKRSIRPAIISDVSTALYANADNLASALLSGGNAFSVCVNNILRSVLATSTRDYVEQAFNEFAAQLDLSSIIDDMDNMDLDSEAIGQKLGKAQDVVGRIVENSEALGGVYKAMATALAVTTNVVAPWLELVLIFLPEIVKMTSYLFGRNKEEQGKAQAKEKIIGEIIPQIEEKLGPAIDDSLEEIQASMIDDVTKSFNERIQIEIDGLRAAQDRLAESREKHMKRISHIDETIQAVSAAIENL